MNKFYSQLKSMNTVIDLINGFKTKMKAKQKIVKGDVIDKLYIKSLHAGEICFYLIAQEDAEIGEEFVVSLVLEPGIKNKLVLDKKIKSE